MAGSAEECLFAQFAPREQPPVGRTLCLQSEIASTVLPLSAFKAYDGLIIVQ